MKNVKLLVIVSIILVGLVGMTSFIKPANKDLAQEGKRIEVSHELGKTEVAVNPQNVLVFDYGVLDALDYMGVEVAGVVQSGLPNYLTHYNSDQYVNLGSLKEPDFEAIYSAKPDLIIISGRQQDFYEQLSEIAPTIYIGIDDNDYLGSFKENMTLLGDIFEKQEIVEAGLIEVEAAISDLQATVEILSSNALISLVNEGAVSVYGAASRFGIIHNTFGFIEADNGIEGSTHGSKVSYEYIANVNPDYLFVVDRGAVVGGESPAAQALDNELIRSTSAYQNDQIIYLNPVIWYTVSGGFNSTLQMVEEVANAIAK